MAVRYVRVDPLVSLFAPGVRAFGTIAVIGRMPASPALPTTPALPATPASPVAVPFSGPDEAIRTFPGELGAAIALAFGQTPGPTLVYGVAVDADAPGWTDALETVAGLPVQLVVLADTPVDPATRAADGPIGLLSAHVTSVSDAGDGRERMGVAMLAKGATTVADIVTNERMVYIAHRSDQDAAAAVAGTIAGYEPSVSLLLKPVNIVSDPFTDAEIDALTGTGVNWLTNPALIPGHGVYLGEAYTGAPGGDKRYIDVCRLVDDLNFRLKARLIGAAGEVRITRSGLRALIAQLEAVLLPLVDADVLNSFWIEVPLLAQLDQDPAVRPRAEARRLVRVLIAVEYAGTVQRLTIDLTSTRPFGDPATRAGEKSSMS